ncbi:histidine kinase [Bacillus manliponensis]|uniref:histidine kinase n=1 Tax=Bacillus manliponensis TaxID=574376 RepID=A0A073K0X2_9BACI|nr:HAMP domain-containing sensor histidine kinase [Bacillus manliponensis]KEK20160.1 histidine kinase [Bacillus manliponensis]
MNLRKRLIIQFIIQHAIILISALFAVFIAFMYLIKLLDDVWFQPNFSSSDSFTVSQYVYKDDDQIILDGEVKKYIKKKSDWLQVVNNDGKILYSFNLPADVPTSYTKTSLVRYLKKEIQTPYKLSYWEIDMEGEQTVVIYGASMKSTALLQTLQAKRSSPDASEFSLTEEEKELLISANAKLQVFDKNGEYISSFPTPKKTSFSPITTALAEKEPWNYKENIASFYNADKELFFILTTPNKHYYPDEEADTLVAKKILTGLGFILLVLALYLIIVAIWYGTKFGKPLLHMMRWLKNIASGTYEEPVNRKGKYTRFRRSGREKWSFRLFRDVIHALEHLTATLKKNEAMRQQIEKTREEWITSLTHDLKTPLSSIYGYALLLESKHYNWNEEDIQKFGAVMREKSQYITTLLDDLSLTYQLKNEAIPFEHVPIEMNQFVQKILLQFINDPALQNQNIEFIPSSNPVHYHIEPKWFQRIIENLVANAVKHNYIDTNVLISLAQDEASFTLSISDDGKGMDEQTKELLFERYYRGTNTEEKDVGTGLGLAIAKQLVLAHNGTISVDSELGKGTTITMKFPFHKDSDRKNCSEV